MMARTENNTLNSCNFIDPNAERIGTRIAIHLTKGNFGACHKLLDHYEKECDSGPPEVIEYIAELPMDPRWINALDKVGYIYIHELTEEVLSNISEIDNAGPKAEAQIRAALEEHNATLEAGSTRKNNSV